MTRIEIARHAAADPASVALLLAEPARLSQPAGPDTGVSGELSPVRRSGTGFAARLDVIGHGGAARGQVSVVPAADGCDVRFTLSVEDDDALTRVAEGWATAYLESLIERARLRASAA